MTERSASADDRAAIRPLAWMMNNAITVITAGGLLLTVGGASYALNDHGARLSAVQTQVTDHEKRLTILETERQQEADNVREILKAVKKP